MDVHVCSTTQERKPRSPWWHSDQEPIPSEQLLILFPFLCHAYRHCLGLWSMIYYAPFINSMIVMQVTCSQCLHVLNISWTEYFSTHSYGHSAVLWGYMFCMSWKESHASMTAEPWQFWTRTGGKKFLLVVYIASHQMMDWHVNCACAMARPEPWTFLLPHNNVVLETS